MIKIAVLGKSEDQHGEVADREGCHVTFRDKYPEKCRNYVRLINRR